MMVKDVKAEAKIDTLELTISEKGEVREVNTFRGPSRVCDAKGVDESGDSVAVSLCCSSVYRAEGTTRGSWS